MPDFTSTSLRRELLDETDEALRELSVLLGRWAKLEEKGKCPHPITLKTKKPRQPAKLIRGIVADLEHKLKLVDKGDYDYRTPEQRISGKEKTSATS